MLGKLLGFPEAPIDPDGGVWVISEPSHPEFGEIIPAEAMADANSVVRRDDIVMVLVNQVWVAAEDFLTFLQSISPGGGPSGNCKSLP